MTRIAHPAWLVIAFLLLAGIAQAQSFDYTTATSSGTYQALTGATTVSPNTDWTNSRFRIPIGFTFTFADSSFDTVSVEVRGFVKFDDERSVLMFYNATCKPDSNNNYSVLSYSTTGTAGNKIFKLQFANCGYDKPNPSEYMNFQLWLYEQDGKVEIHTGPVSYPGYVVDPEEEIPTPLVGLINPMQNWSTSSSLLISGDPASPTYQAVPTGNDLVYMNCVPPADKIYSFTPSN